MDDRNGAPKPRCVAGQGRSLSTARAVLRVLDFMARRPPSVGVDEVASILGKSPWTARYVLNSLVQEGFAVHEGHAARYRLDRPWLVPPAVGETACVPEILRALSLRTRQRAYLAVWQDGAVVVEVAGKQGLPVMQGVGPRLTRDAHALAIGKALLAYLPSGVVANYAEVTGLPAFTPKTITDSRELGRELEVVRALGVAFDREEHQEGFCCVAAPVFNLPGQVIGSLGVSVAAKRFPLQRHELARAVAEAARRASGAPRDPVDTGELLGRRPAV